MNNPNTSPPDPWLTVGEIAEELRVNPATVRLWVSKGQLQATRAGMRKWLVRRSDLDRMLVAANPPTRDPGPDASVSTDSVQGTTERQDAASTYPPPVGTAEDARALVEHAESRLRAAFQASALAPPSAGYPERLRAIADGFEHSASTLLHAGRVTPTTWIGRDWGLEWLPYELRPGGNRPVREGLWDQFDAAMTALVEALAGTDVLAVGRAFRAAGDELLAVVDQLAEADRQPADSSAG